MKYTDAEIKKFLTEEKYSKITKKWLYSEDKDDYNIAYRSAIHGILDARARLEKTETQLNRGK
jgi:hypothetical protein